MIRRAGIVLGATSTALVLGAGSAIAHDCYVANRSSQGDEGAAHSQAWYTVDVAQEFFWPLTQLMVPDEEGELVAFWTEAQADCMTTTVAESGALMTFTTHVKGAGGVDGVIGGANPSDGWVSDGKGVDAWFASNFSTLMAALEECGAPDPTAME